MLCGQFAVDDNLPSSKTYTSGGLPTIMKICLAGRVFADQLYVPHIFPRFRDLNMTLVTQCDLDYFRCTRPPQVSLPPSCSPPAPTHTTEGVLRFSRKLLAILDQVRNVPESAQKQLYT